MAFFCLFGDKDKKNTQINNSNKSQMLAIITQTQMSCRNAEALTLLRNITAQLQGQGETASKEVMTIDGEILKLLTEANTYLLKQQNPTAITKLNRVANLVIDRSQYCMMGGRKTKQDQKLENQAKRAMANVKAAPKTRAEELQSRLDDLNAELEGALKEQEQLKALYEQNRNNAAIIGRAHAVRTKIASLRNQVNATTLELQKESQEAAIIETVAINTELESTRTHNESEMEIARTALESQNQAKVETQAQLAADSALLNQGAAGLFTDDPFADPFQDMATTANLFGDTTGTMATAATPQAQTQYGAFDASAMGTSSMAKDIKNAQRELENSMNLFNDKIEDANDELQDLNAELRPLLERRRTASPSDCLTLDGMIDQINAKRNGVINKIKRYRQATAQLSDKLSLLDKLDTQQDLTATNAKIAQLTNGKFADFQGLAMFLNDSIKQSNEELEEIGLAASVAEGEEIMMSSSSAASAVLSDTGTITKDEHKYDSIAQEIGMTLV
ncbi:MAG: hypothetical protein IJX30_06055 [Clostridia bacterium]|nr:hypothetical protein [Clostridia bacterium]